MNKRKLWTLIAVPGLAVTGLLLVFLLLGRSTVGATPDGDDAIPDIRSHSITFTVSGTVICEVTGPISDVEVFVWNRDQGTGFTGDLTDSSGYYSVTLEEGNYDLNFNPPCGSGCASRSLKGITGPSDLILNVVLSPGHSVSGTVLTTDGITPVGNVAIYAFNHETADGFGLPPTDASGHYCIGLVTGTYDLGFTPPPCLGFGPTTAVTPVTQDMTLNVTLPPGFTVAGCVTDGIGNPVPGVQIYAYDPDIGGFGFAPTNETGCYTGTLPYAGTPLTGTYDIQFIPPAGLGLGSVTVIDVTSTTSNCPNATLPITLPTGFTLSGRVTCNGEGIKNVFVYALPEGPQDPRNSLPGYGLFTVDDGSYRLPLVPGTYSLEFTPPEATGLNAKAFTTVALITDTVLNVDFCVCSGVWVTETVDSAGNVGQYTSLALAPTYPYTPHISYRNIITDRDYYLKYAWLSGNTWLSETVDSGGTHTSLALVPTYPYTPCIGYHDYWGWDLRYACRDNMTWTITTVDGGMRAGQGGTPLALEPTYPYTPHISYRNPWGTLRTLFHAYLSGTTWMSGTWVKEMVEPPLSRTGGWNSLALEPTYPYTPHISYFDLNNRDLKHAWLSGTTWLSETVDSAGDVGGYTSLALDSSGNPHISYFDDTNDSLKYAWLSGTIWFSETVDSTGQRGWGTGATSLELDQADAPYISYYDAINGDLKLARLNGRVWIIKTVDSGGDVGQHSSLALDQAGCPHISYYNATNGDLKYAYLPTALADVAIVKSGRPPTVMAGDWLTYTLRITNTGNVDLHATVTDTLPTHVTPGGVLTWTPTITAPGGVWVQTVPVTIEWGYAGPLTNVVEVTTEEGATGATTATVNAIWYEVYLPLVLRGFP